jgi:hypothetical protein
MITSPYRFGLPTWPDDVTLTMAWVTRYRRLKICNERREDIHGVLLHPDSSLICLNYLM